MVFVRVLKAIGCSRAGSTMSWELEEDEAAKDVRSDFPITYHPVVIKCSHSCLIHEV